MFDLIFLIILFYRRSSKVPDRVRVGGEFVSGISCKCCQVKWVRGIGSPGRAPCFMPWYRDAGS